MVAAVAANVYWKKKEAKSVSGIPFMAKCSLEYPMKSFPSPNAKAKPINQYATPDTTENQEWKMNVYICNGRSE